jgi:hypothetical protein
MAKVVPLVVEVRLAMLMFTEFLKRVEVGSPYRSRVVRPSVGRLSCRRLYSVEGGWPPG